MDRKISTETRTELVKVLGCRYRDSVKQDKVRILDEFVALSGYHRKHAIRILANSAKHRAEQSATGEVVRSRRVYDEAVKEALVTIWEAADRICSKRLKAILCTLVEAMGRPLMAESGCSA